MSQMKKQAELESIRAFDSPVVRIERVVAMMVVAPEMGVFGFAAMCGIPPDPYAFPDWFKMSVILASNVMAE